MTPRVQLCPAVAGAAPLRAASKLGASSPAVAERPGVDGPALPHRRQLRWNASPLALDNRLKDGDRLGKKARDFVCERFGQGVVNYRLVDAGPRSSPLLQLHLRAEAGLDLGHVGCHQLRPTIGEVAGAPEGEADLDAAGPASSAHFGGPL